MRGASRVVLILTAVVLLPSLAFAQGTLTGTVKDQSGSVLPGVTVEASSPVLIEKVRTGDHRRRGTVPHHRSQSGHLLADVHAARLQRRQARGRRARRHRHADNSDRDECRRGGGDDHGHRRDAGGRRPDHRSAKLSLSADVIAAIPAHARRRLAAERHRPA